MDISNASSCALHRELAELNGLRLTPRLPAAGWESLLQREHELRKLELGYVEGERAGVRVWAESAPSEPQAFLRWFEGLKQHGPGQSDPLFPWLARRASRTQMKWFLRQELAGEAGFDDLVALTQLKLPLRPKLELARNYWDEMGRGHVRAVHGLMLDQLAQELSLSAHDEQVWEPLALANLMVALAANRQYAYHALGALGVVELTAPGRSALVNAGLQRLGVDGDARRYFALHATLDKQHSKTWNQEVLLPLVASEPRAATAFAEGALLRLRAGARCFDRYRAALQLTQDQLSRDSRDDAGPLARSA